jgi:arylsulfatase A-like enzyme
LEAGGKARNTIVILTSDNGGLATSEGSPTCNAPLAEGKGWMYEGGTRVSLLVRRPEHVAAGSVCTTPVCSMDIYPTVLDAAELPPLPEQHRDGVSIMPLLDGNGTFDRDALYWHFPHYGNQGGTPAGSIRMGDYKLIEFFEDRHVELFDLRTDIGEEHNLAPSDPDRVRGMQARLAAWRSEIEAAMPTDNPDYDAWPDRAPSGRFAPGE